MKSVVMAANTTRFTSSRPAHTQGSAGVRALHHTHWSGCACIRALLSRLLHVCVCVCVDRFECPTQPVSLSGGEASAHASSLCCYYCCCCVSVLVAGSAQHNQLHFRMGAPGLCGFHAAECMAVSGLGDRWKGGARTHTRESVRTLWMACCWALSETARLWVSTCMCADALVRDVDMLGSMLATSMCWVVVALCVGRGPLQTAVNHSGFGNPTPSGVNAQGCCCLPMCVCK